MLSSKADSFATPSRGIDSRLGAKMLDHSVVPVLAALMAKDNLVSRHGCLWIRLLGRTLQLILTDGCAGLAAAIRTIYPRVRHQRCWVHKMRNILEKARKCDYEEVKVGAQAIYLAESLNQIPC